VQTSGVTRLTVLVFVALTIAVPFPASAYAVFAHEANVDALWGTGIRPLLERRYPRATREQLQDARAYAYGGSVIQDLGYYQVNAFIYRYTRKQYEQEFGAKYRKPGLLARFVGLLYRMLPKFGPLRPLRFKTPSPEAERLFSASFRETRARYAAADRDRQRHYRPRQHRLGHGQAECPGRVRARRPDVLRAARETG
jgi:hypothetical protein